VSLMANAPVRPCSRGDADSLSIGILHGSQRSRVGISQQCCIIAARQSMLQRDLLKEAPASMKQSLSHAFRDILCWRSPKSSQKHD
jgi:hypothetical protein